jgi:protein-tyrosine phosphatase
MSMNLYPITGPWPDADLATAACPYGGASLADELRAWKDANIEVVVSALTLGEASTRKVLAEDELCAQLGLTFIRFPIGDRDIPDAEIDDLIREILDYLNAGRSVVIHCRAGIGRASLLAACTLVRAGVSAEEAVARISLARGVAVLETDAQREWVRQFAQQRKQGEA